MIKKTSLNIHNLLFITVLLVLSLLVLLPPHSDCANDVEAKCFFNEKTRNETCLLHVDTVIDIGIVKKELKFDASVSAVVDLKDSGRVALLLTFNDKIVFSGKVSIDELEKGVCASIFSLLGLCVQFKNTHFSAEKNCFTSDIYIYANFFGKHVDLVNNNFGWNQSSCKYE